MNRSGHLSLVLLWVAAWASGGDSVNIVKLAERPTLDGKLDDACWKKATRLTGFTQKGRPVAGETHAMVFCDDAALYVGVHCQEPLVKEMRRRHTRHDAPVWADDCIELFIDADLDRQSYVHLLANAVDGRADGFHAQPKAFKVGMLFDLDWTSKAFVGSGYWSVEFRVPFHSLNLPDRPVHDIGFCICRERYPVNEYCAWGGWFHKPKAFGVLTGIRLSREANPLHVRQLDLGEMLWGENELSAVLVNLASPDRCTLTLSVLGEGRVLDTRRQQVQLPKGKPVRVVQRYRVPPGGRPSGGYLLRVGLDRGGKSGPLPIVARKFRVPSETIARITLDGGGVCYSDAAAAKVQVRCFLSRLTVQEGLLLDVSAANEAGEVVYRRPALPFSTQSTVHAMPLGDVPEGWYRVRVALREQATQKPLADAVLALRKVRGPFER